YQGVCHKLPNGDFGIHGYLAAKSLTNLLVGRKPTVDVADQTFETDRISFRSFLLLQGMNPVFPLVLDDTDALPVKTWEAVEIISEEYGTEVIDIVSVAACAVDEAFFRELVEDSRATLRNRQSKKAETAGVVEQIEHLLARYAPHRRAALKRTLLQGGPKGLLLLW